jgi:hypothetical protein
MKTADGLFKGPNKIQTKDTQVRLADLARRSADRVEGIEIGPRECRIGGVLFTHKGMHDGLLIRHMIESECVAEFVRQHKGEIIGAMKLVDRNVAAVVLAFMKRRPDTAE